MKTNQEELIKLEKKIQSDYSNTTGIVVLKNGQTVYENYFNDCDAISSIHVFSVTKSIISLLLGIAIKQKYIHNVNQPVLDFFPEYSVKRGEKTIQKITIKNLLTMTAPFKYKSAPYTKYFKSNDWVKSSLDFLGGKDSIGEFRYLPLIGPDILSGILTRSIGKSVLEFATEQLFNPLGIHVKETITFKNKAEQLAFYKAKNISGWVADPQGINTAGWGLTLTTMDMAKIGQLCLNNGIWNEQQIIPKSWLEESIQEHSKWKELNLSFGYLWWIIDQQNLSYAAMGDGGNVIYVNSKENIVISLSGLFIPNAEDRIDLIKTIIEPLFIK